MFKWFNKFKKADDKGFESVEKRDKYRTYSDGSIGIYTVRPDGYPIHHNPYISIPKESIISYTEYEIVFEDYRYCYNYQLGNGLHPVIYGAIEGKQNFIKYKQTVIKTFKYNPVMEGWKNVANDFKGKEIVCEKTPLEVFKKDYNSKYKLIENEEEFNEYMYSNLNCDTWCRRKLYNKMKELELGDGFINQFADLIGNNLDKYHAMIDLANEVSDKDTLMYLYTYKFGDKGK